MEEITRILTAIESGDPQAAEQLLPIVYDELRMIAAQRLKQEKPGQTIQATALVHEAYLRLVGSNDPGWNGRGHFLSAAAEAMRRILIENARRKSTAKRGADAARIDIDIEALPSKRPISDSLEIESALEALEQAEPEAARVVRLRFYAGLSIPEVAKLMQVSPRKVDGLWAYARAWLLRKLRDESDETNSEDDTADGHS